MAFDDYAYGAAVTVDSDENLTNENDVLDRYSALHNCFLN